MWSRSWMRPLLLCVTLAIDPKNCDVLGGWAIKELVGCSYPIHRSKLHTRRRHCDETIASVLAALNEIIRARMIRMQRFYFKKAVLTKMKGMLNAKANVHIIRKWSSIPFMFSIPCININHYTTFYKQNGYKENDFLHHRFGINSKSLTSSPQSTLHQTKRWHGTTDSFHKQRKTNHSSTT